MLLIGRMAMPDGSAAVGVVRGVGNVVLRGVGVAIGHSVAVGRGVILADCSTNAEEIARR